MLERIVTTTALICGVMLVRGLLGHHISMRLRYALWGLVLLRLLLPISLFSSPVSAMNAVDTLGRRAAPAAVSQENDGEESPSRAVDEITPLKQAAVSEASATPDSGRAIPRERVLERLWLAGVLAVGTWFGLVNIRFYRRLRRVRRPLAVPECPIPVYRADFLPSPCLVGMVRPGIYLNEAAMKDAETLEHVLTHELCHRRQGDNLWAFLRGVCLALWWFHPLVWVAAVFSKRDCELACDERAVKRLGEGARLSYGRTLVSLVASHRLGPGELLCAATTMTAGKRQIKERVIQVSKKKKMTRRALVLALVVSALVGLCGFTGAVTWSVPSAMPYQVQPAQGLVVTDLDPTAPAIPDFDWSGDRMSYCREVGIRWAAEYGKQYYALPDGHPWKAADVQVIPAVFHNPGLMAIGYVDGDVTRFINSAGPYEKDEVSKVSGFFNLAIRPVGGIEAVDPLFRGGTPRGTGALADYAMMEYHYDLERVVAPGGGLQWVGRGEGKYVTPGWNVNPPPEVADWTDEQMTMWRENLPLGMIATVEGTGQAAWEEAGAAWAENFAWHHQLCYDTGHPAKADDAQVLSMELTGWGPEQDPDTLYFHLKYAIRPLWDREKAQIFMARYGGGTGGTPGQGDWEEYLMIEADVTLTKDHTWKEGEYRWKGTAFQGR